MTLMLDVSSNNHPNGTTFDYAAAKESGYEWVYVKATQGDYYTNPYAVDDLKGFKDAGFRVGVYHYFDATINVVGQAQYFESELAKIISASGVMPTLVRALDYEQGEPSAEVVADFGRASSEPSVTYMDRSFAQAIGPPKGWPIWLAWPGYSTARDISGLVGYGTVAAVQCRQPTVPGIGVADVSTVVDPAAFSVPDTKPAPVADAGAPGSYTSLHNWWWTRVPSTPTELPLYKEQYVRLPDGSTLTVVRIAPGVVRYL